MIKMFKRKKKESEEQHLKCSIDKLIAIIVVSEIDHKHQIKKKHQKSLRKQKPSDYKQKVTIRIELKTSVRSPSLSHSFSKNFNVVNV